MSLKTLENKCAICKGDISSNLGSVSDCHFRIYSYHVISIWPYSLLVVHELEALICASTKPMTRLLFVYGSYIAIACVFRQGRLSYKLL